MTGKDIEDAQEGAVSDDAAEEAAGGMPPWPIPYEVLHRESQFY